MYQELTSVYGEQCTTQSMTQQSSFENDEGFSSQAGLSQGYHSYTFGAPTESGIPSHVYTAASSGSFGSQGDLRQVDTRQHMVAMPTGYPDNQQPQLDLPAILSHPELQWITTSHTDMRMQSPIDTSSPRPSVPSIYPTQNSPLNQSMHAQGALEDPQQAAAIITHHHLPQHSYSSVSAQDPPPLQRVKKTAASSTTPPKPKGTPGRKRKFQDYELTPAEASKRHVRRERNKVAAAKCRNRRRELTDRLQGETDHLEDHQNLLHQEIMSLQQEKEHLEFILAAHNPNCKAGIPAVDTSLMSHEEAKMMSGSLGSNIEEMSLVPPPEAIDDVITTHADPNFYYTSQRNQEQVLPVMQNVHNNENTPFDVTNEHSMVSRNTPTDLSNHNTSYTNTNLPLKNQLSAMNLDDLHTSVEAPLDTPVCTLTTPSQGNIVFTFPNTPTVPNPPTDIGFSFHAPSTTDYFSSRNSNSQTSSVTSYSTMPTNRLGMSCSAAHRRSSSSESHQSPDSVKSPKLLAL